MQEIKSEAVTQEATEKEVKVVRKVEIVYKDDNTFTVNPVAVEGQDAATEQDAFADVEAVAELLKEGKENAKVQAQIQQYHNALLEQILVPFEARLRAVEEKLGLREPEAPAQEAAE